MAVHRDVTVGDQLTGTRTRGRKSKTVGNVVEAAFAHGEHDVARDPLLGLRTLEEKAELLLAHAVDGFRLLLLAELDAVFRHLFAALVRAMLAGRIRTALQHLVRTEDRLSETTGNLGPGTCIATHFTLSSVCADGTRYARAASYR